MKSLKLLAALLFITLLSSCEDNQSIQKYYVENQEDADFLALDVPTSLFAKMDALDADQKETMESIKKINLLALKADTDRNKFEEEKARLDEIFTDEKYQLLMKYGGGNRKAALYFTGEDDAIDELIVYGYDDEKGLGLARVLGEDMNPSKIMELMKSLDKEDIDMQGLKGFAEMFGSSDKKMNDSIHVGMEIHTDSLQTEEDSISKE